MPFFFYRIEHLYPETLADLPYNIFGYMKPKLIIFTTPNYKFNVLFKSCKYENGYRHDDHKFEWTEEQFQDWSLNICEQYTDYRVSFHGIGPGPPDAKQYGCVSQLALFVRNDFLLENIGESDNLKILNDNVTACETKKATEQITPTMHPFKQQLPPLIKLLEYEKIFTHTYPVYIDDRSREEKILNECQFHIGRYMSMDEEYFNCERYLYLIPVVDLFKYVEKVTDSIREMRAVLLKNGYKINKEDILEIEPEEEEEEENSSSTSEDEKDTNEENKIDCPMEIDQKNEEAW